MNQELGQFAEPDSGARQVVGERVFVRTLGKRCPHCPRVFFTYQVEGQEREPYRTDPEVMLDVYGRPLNGIATRDTCGSPECHEREDFHQFRRRLEYRAEHAKQRMGATA